MNNFNQPTPYPLRATDQTPRAPLILSPARATHNEPPARPAGIRQRHMLDLGAKARLAPDTHADWPMGIWASGRLVNRAGLEIRHANGLEVTWGRGIRPAVGLLSWHSSPADCGGGVKIQSTCCSWSLSCAVLQLG